MVEMLKKALFVLATTLLLASGANARSSYDLRSPNSKVEIKIRTANGVRYDVLLNGRAVLKIAQYVAVARRNGKDWYVGAMTNWSPREMEIDFSFLPEGNFTLQAYQDGVNADRMGSDYKMTKTQVNRGAKLKIKLAPGEGWAGRITQ